MQLIDLIEVEKNYSEIPQGLNFALSRNFHFPKITHELKAEQPQATEQPQNQCEKKPGCQDTLKHMQIEALKDLKSVDEALSLLTKLRDGSQISDSAHESLSKAFMLLSKGKNGPAAHSDKEDGMQSPSERRDAEMVDEAMLRAAGTKVPQRKSTLRPFKHPSSKRKQLTSEEAAEIYSMRPELTKGSFFRRGCMVKSKMIAPHFGVNAKTVRDIWHGRTWVSATKHLWTEEEIALRAKGVVESDEEDKNDSPGSVDNAKLQNLSQNKKAGQFTSLPAISSLRNQAMMGGMSGLSLQLPFASSVPSALPHHFSSVDRQQAAMSGLLLNGLAQENPLGFAGCHPGFGMGARNLFLPEVSPSLLKLPRLPI